MYQVFFLKYRAYSQVSGIPVISYRLLVGHPSISKKIHHFTKTTSIDHRVTRVGEWTN